jgi:hypothetical protein
VIPLPLKQEIGDLRTGALARVLLGFETPKAIFDVRGGGEWAVRVGTSQLLLAEESAWSVGFGQAVADALQATRPTLNLKDANA